MWWRRKRGDVQAGEVDDFFQVVEQEFLLGRTEITRAAIGVLHGASLVDASLDEARGSLRLWTELGSVLIATDRVEESREILSMLHLEPVMLIAGAREGRIHIVARSALWSYAVSGIVSLCDEVPL